MFLKHLIILLFPMMIMLIVNCSNNSDYIKLAAEIHSKVLTVDTHVDTPMRLTSPDFDLSEKHDVEKDGGRLDFPRMQEGGLDAAFFAVFLGQGPRTPEANEKAKERALKIFEAIHNAVEKYPDLAEIALTPEDAIRLEKENKRAIFIGMENGYPVGKDLNLVKQFYDLGARYITLSHTKNNDICDSSTDEKGPEHHGLSDFGVQVVKEMNRLGMMVDISHVSDETFYDVLEITKAPVIASHSCTRALCDHPRNINDDMLKKLADNGGVIQITLLSDYVKKMASNPEREAAFKELRKKYKNFDDLPDDEKQKARKEWQAARKKYPVVLPTVADFVDHIDHVVKVAGIDHVGIGSDFDGGGGLQDCRDVSEMGKITLELVQRGYSEKDIRKIWGGNLLRVMSDVEKAAAGIPKH